MLPGVHALARNTRIHVFLRGSLRQLRALSLWGLGQLSCTSTEVVGLGWGHYRCSQCFWSLNGILASLSAVVCVGVVCDCAALIACHHVWKRSMDCVGLSSLHVRLGDVIAHIQNPLLFGCGAGEL